MDQLPLNQELPVKLLLEKTVLLLLLLSGERINSLATPSVESIQLATTKRIFIRVRNLVVTIVLLTHRYGELEIVGTIFRCRYARIYRVDVLKKNPIIPSYFFNNRNIAGFIESRCGHGTAIQY